MSTSFREPAPEAVQEPVAAEEHEKDDTGLEESVEGLEPATDRIMLDSLGIEYGESNLSQSDKENFNEVRNYLYNYMGEKGLAKTSGGIKKAIEAAKTDFGLDEEADPQSIIERIGSVAKSYRSLSFVKDLDERKGILVKLLSAGTVREMDRIVFEMMEKKKIWLQ